MLGEERNGDMYVVDLATKQERRLTSDATEHVFNGHFDWVYEEEFGLAQAWNWSPDSRRIAFATDRYSSDLETMRIGALRLAIVDAATGTPEVVPAFHTGKQINPQWTPDGQALYFIGDPDGIANIYRVSLASGTTMASCPAARRAKFRRACSQTMLRSPSAW